MQPEILLLVPSSVNHGFAKNTRSDCAAGSDLTAGLRDTPGVAPGVDGTANDSPEMLSSGTHHRRSRLLADYRRYQPGIGSVRCSGFRRKSRRKSRGKSREKSRDCRAAQSGVLLRLMSSDPIAFCDFLDGHQIGCGSEVADAVFLLQHRPHLLKCFSHCVIKT